MIELEYLEMIRKRIEIVYLFSYPFDTRRSGDYMKPADEILPLNIPFFFLINFLLDSNDVDLSLNIVL